MTARSQKHGHSIRVRRRPTFSPLGTVALRVAGTVLACAATAAFCTAALTMAATKSRTLRVSDAAHLHRVPSQGTEILEKGTASGTLPGTVTAYLNVGATVIAHFTIHTSSGSISGVGSGKLKGRPAEPSFGGTMTVQHGTGRYAHAHGTGGFYGTINRSSYRAVVETKGTLSY